MQSKVRMDDGAAALVCMGTAPLWLAQLLCGVLETCAGDCVRSATAVEKPFTGDAPKVHIHLTLVRDMNRAGVEEVLRTGLDHCVDLLTGLGKSLRELPVHVITHAKEAGQGGPSVVTTEGWPRALQ